MNIIICRETLKDHKTVERFLFSAFSTDAENRVVNAVRENGNAVISLVAVSWENVGGHILFSPVTIHPPTQQNGLGLALVAVDLAFQLQVIVSKLTRVGL